MFLQSSGSRTRCALTALRIADEEKARLQTRIRQLEEDLAATGNRSDADIVALRKDFEQQIATLGQERAAEYGDPYHARLSCILPLSSLSFVYVCVSVAKAVAAASERLTADHQALVDALHKQHADATTLMVKEVRVASLR